ncbi:MAG: gfo/Idh/MocA family oxidoreductase [Candidatus Omnitrophota bacterium]|nr:MAG: gfo/Idh/MocA family oxidoreductase [Candidatus Omnitrophota bacterium]
MTEKPYGVGLVGFGFMGRTHTFGYHTIPFYYSELPIPYQLKGVCVRREETIAQAKAIAGFEFGTTNYQKLLERDDIHIIHVCTPNDLHREQVIAAIRARKHVYCDKPLGGSYEDCEAMVEALAIYGKGLVTQVCLQYRFYPCTMRAKQLVDEGFLGRVMSFRACYLHASSINPDKPLSWKLDIAKGGGVLYDLGSHVLDLVNWLIGPFEEVCAATHTVFPQRRHPETGEMVPVEADDMALMCLRTKDGALGSIEASKIATGTNDELRVEIHGEKGAIRFNLMDPNWLEIYDARDAGEPMGGKRGFKKIETVRRYPAPGDKFPAPAVNIGWLRGHVACLYNFLAAIGGKAEAHPTIPQAAELQRIMDQAYLSAEIGTWEKL